MADRHRLKRAIEDLLDPSVALHVAADRHFAPGFVQTVDGRAVDRATFMAGIETLRSQLQQVSVTVLDELHEANRYAERHRIELTFREGTRMVREVHVFAELDAASRLTRIDELTRAVS